MRLEDVPMVQNFFNMFSNKLSNLPLEREMNFAIDLIQKTKPISLPLYRMTLVELKELKTQF